MTAPPQRLEFESSLRRYSEIIGRPMDNTAMADYMACAWKFFAGMRQHRRKRGLTSALAYGSSWHHIMQAHYTAPEMSIDALYDYVLDFASTRWQPGNDPSDHRTFNRAMVEYEKYVKEYGLPWKEEGKTLGWPDSPMIEMAIELPIPGARHPYVGKLDRIILYNGQYLIEDHKTASQFRSDYFKQWELSNQMMGYAVLASLVTGQQIAGVRINLHVIHKSDSIFERRTIPFSKPRLDDWMKNYDVWLNRLEGDIIRERVGDPHAFPRNFNACATKYGMCQYAEVCSLPPHLRMRSLEADFDQVPWNPLEAAEEGLDA